MYRDYFDRHFLDLEPLTFKEIRELQKEEAEIQRLYFHRARFKGGGKSRGKLLGSILLGVLTAGFAPGLGLAAHGFAANLGNFMLGASLFSSIWTATHQPELDNNSSSLDVKRFDRAAEQMSSSAAIQVVYGERLIAGNQTWHETDADAQTLHKHVCLCEGGIEGVVSVTANDMLLPTDDLGSGVVFTIQNIKYADATIEKNGKTLRIFANGKAREIYLCNRDDSSGSYWSYQVSVSSLISYINSLGEGWQAFPLAATSAFPGDLHNFQGNCYKKVVTVTANTVAGGTKYVYHDCETPENYETVGGYPNLAWLDLTFTTQSDFSGNPSITAVVKGKKVYDVRTGETAYSTNPAMCLRDFILSKRYGLGKWFTADMLDDDSWAEAANYCDEIITFLDGSGTNVQAKRYELNMIIDQQRTGLEWVQEMLANFAGYLVYSDGKIKLRIEQQTPVSYRFTDDNCFDLKIEPLKLSETPNRYEVTIIDPLNNWSSVKALCEDFADQKLRQRIVTKSVNLEGVTSQNQALRLARFYRDYNLVCPFQMSFKTGMQGMSLEPGDVVTLSYHGVFTDMPIRIAEIKETNAGTYEISGRQYNDTLYGDALGGGIHYYNYSGDKGLNGGSDADGIRPNSPRNVKAKIQYRRYADGNVGYDIVVTYTLPSGEDIETGLVYYKINHATGENIIFNEGIPADQAGYDLPWSYAGDSPTTCIIGGAKLGDTYKIKVITRSRGGLLSNESDIITVKVLPKSTVPATPQNLKYDFTNSFYFSWEDVADSDAQYYELRLDKKVGNPINMLAQSQGFNATIKALTKRKDTVYLFAINNQGKASFPAVVTYDVPKPDAPHPITFQEVPIGVKIIAPNFPYNCHRMLLRIEGNTHSITTNTYTYQGTAGIFTVSACYVDLFGEGTWSIEYQMTVNPVFKPEWIADESISLEKMDSVIKNAVKDAQDSVPRLNGIDTDIEGINTDILNINGNITELVKADGEIRTTITETNQATNERFASQLKQTADTITATVAKNKKDQDGVNETLASQITQTASEINATIESKESGLRSDISKVSLKADGISSTVAKNKTDQDGVNESLASQITQTASEVSTTLQNQINGINTDISQIRQTAESLSTTVQSNKKSLTSQITQQADRITSVVTELGKSPDKCSYSAITQLQSGINLRVAKTDFNGQNIVNQINLSPQGTTIDGKYLHVTGTTKFDNNVIVGGMIKSGSITADKLSAGTISLTNSQGIQGGAALLNANGLTVTTNSGFVTFTSQGMSFKDANGQAFSVVGRLLTGVANDGQYVRFTQPWDVVPTVMVIPTHMQTCVANYGSANTFTKCYVENLSKSGFSVRCYSCLGAGSSGIAAINKDYNLTVTPPSAANDSTRVATTVFTATLDIPTTATEATINAIADLKGISGYLGNSHWYGCRGRVTLHWIVDGNEVGTSSADTPDFSSIGQVNEQQTFRIDKNTSIAKKLTFSAGAVISVKIYFDAINKAYGNVNMLPQDGSKFNFGTVQITSATLNTNTTSIIATGTAAFIVTDTNNQQYTVT